MTVSAEPVLDQATPTPTHTIRRRPATQRERGVVSDADRRRPVVRVVLTVIQLLTLAGLIVAGLGPLLWSFKASVSTSQDIIAAPMSLWPHGIQWGNLPRAWNEVQIGSYLGNTAVLAIGSAISTLFVCTTGAYVLSVLRPRWGKILSGAVLGTLFLPGVVSLVPLYLTVLHLPGFGFSLQNTFWAVWLPAGASAFNVVVLKRFFDTIPRELLEAARIDGAGTFRIFSTLIIPLSRPILGVVALLTIIASWKDYLWPMLVLTNPQLQPVSVALPTISKTAPMSLQMGALFLTVIIPVALFLIFQKQFLRGVGMAGGIKE